MQGRGSDNQSSGAPDHTARGQVLTLNTPFRPRSKAARQTAVLQQFATQRRGANDVFWLKENAEVLGVFEATAQDVGPAGLSVYDAFYDDLDARAGFFPQYYRFFLALALDLEDLGRAGDTGERIAHWVASSGFVGAELSDLQRAEARRLCLRRGVDPIMDAGLDDRLRAFTERSETFALPNKKAAYELTHIVFYLSEYGRRDPCISAQSCQSLRHAGTLAFLELNIDLLSEVCVALRFAGETPPEAWERWLCDQVRRFGVHGVETPAPRDDYHPWLMLNWFMEVSGQGGFGAQMPENSVLIAAPTPAAGPLRELSDSMYNLGAARSDDWTVMRDDLGEAMSEDARSVLLAAEQAVDFGAFFRGFARVGGPAMPQAGVI